MDSPEIKETFESVSNPISKKTNNSNNGLGNNMMLSSSVPNGHSQSFITDSSEKSDDSSSIITGIFNEDGEDGEDGDAESGGSGDVTRNTRKLKYSVPEPIIYTSRSDSTTSSSPSLVASPTSVYATMLNANNIVSNSMNVLQSGTRLPNPPTLIEYVGLRFLIMDAPSQSNLRLYLKEMERVGVKDIVRICEPTYPRELVESSGIKVHDWVFPDGESPPAHVIDSWIALVDSKKTINISSGTESSSTSAAIAVHCVAGLGRAPVLVAIALIENGMGPLDAVMFIRKRRRGAINNKQLKFLENYRPRHLKKDKCIIM